MSHKDAPPESDVQRAVREFYTARLAPRGETVGWGRDKHGEFLAQYARDAEAAWHAARATASPQADDRPAPSAVNIGLAVPCIDDDSLGAPTDPLLYVASRASVPERPAMWRALRASGWRIASSWIDEAGEGETASYSDLWSRIEREIASCDGLILYAEVSDFPLKGAFIEVGMAIGMRKPVAVVLREPWFLEERSMRPVGSWLHHPGCAHFPDLDKAREWIADRHLRDAR